jgi:glucosamine--fructose-6-phosphate aminotransferase (isomerizing)
MLKEIYEQPSVIKDTYRGRLHANEGLIQMSGVEDNLEKFLNADRIIYSCMCASSYAGLVAEYVLKSFRELKWNMSEFRYRNPIINSNDVVIAISQSGETLIRWLLSN